jgi:hypothetical protein
MSNPREVQTDRFPETLAGRENERSACTPENDKATSWFVPPLVVPALLVALIFARVAYQAYF